MEFMLCSSFFILKPIHVTVIVVIAAEIDVITAEVLASMALI